MKSNTSKARIAGALLFVAALTVAMVGCNTPTPEPEPQGQETEMSNDTAVKGEYTPFVPSDNNVGESGTAIEGSEEEQLQQERIAGGAAGAVTSFNLEPLTGVTDYSEGDYVPTYGIEITPAEVVHGSSMGTTCTTCHSATPAGSATALPASHLEQNLEDADCITCHAID